jgi:tetratricopeptide (TPR) repeat protein
MSETLFQRAYQAMASSDWPLANALWAEGRVVRAPLVDGWVHGATALMRIGRTADAEALLEQTRAKFPDDRDVQLYLAFHAKEQQDWPTANRLFTSIRSTHPNMTDGWLHGAIALTRLGRAAEAEALLDQAATRFPNEMNVLLVSAHNAFERSDWARADRDFARLRAIRPEIGDPWSHGVRALQKLGQADAATILLAEALQRFPDDLGLTIFAGHDAIQRMDWQRARELWGKVRTAAPERSDAWVNGVLALDGLQLQAEAAAMMARVLALQPDAADVLTFAAHRAHRHGNPAEAAGFWAEVLRRVPDDKEALRQHNKMLYEHEVRSLGTEREANAGADFRDPAGEAAASRREMLLGFQGLGHSCEFGMVQRAFGAEPLGLFRWVGIRGTELIASIRAGLPEFETAVDARLTREHVRAEYYLELPATHFLMHTHVSQSEEPVRLLTTLRRRLRRLREKFIEDMQAGEHIFVRRAQVAGMSRTEMIELHDALKTHGKARLLCVCAEPGPRVGKVERIRDGLAVGYLDRFFDNEGVDQVSLETWVSLCHQSIAIFNAEALLAQATVA